MSGIVKVVVDKDRKHRADRIKMKCRNHDLNVHELTDCSFIIDGYFIDDIQQMIISCGYDMEIYFSQPDYWFVKII